MGKGFYQKKDIKQGILDIFNIQDMSLNPFQAKLFGSDNLMEKHFNLRSWYKFSENDKIENKVYKSLFSESLSNRYLKIKMTRQFMKELGYESLEQIQFIKQKKTLCSTCTTSILNPKEPAKKKSHWCNELIAQLDPEDKLSKKVYENIVLGRTKICKSCQRLLNEKVIVSKDIFYSPPKLNKFIEKIKS